MRWNYVPTSTYCFQAEAGIRGGHVTGVQTCALPILTLHPAPPEWLTNLDGSLAELDIEDDLTFSIRFNEPAAQIGRASCRERVWISVGAGLRQDERGRRGRADQVSGRGSVRVTAHGP